MLGTARWVLLSIAMCFSAGLAQAENPLTDGRQLRSFLQDVWFVERYAIRVSLIQDGNRIHSIRYFNLRGTSPEAGEYAFKNSEMTALTDAWNIRLDGVANGPALWRVPAPIMECCYESSQDQKTVVITFGGRITMADSIEYSEWVEGNLEFAQARGEYMFFNSLTGESKLYKFRVLVERNPASDGWFLSTYRGEESFYEKADTYGLYLDLQKL